MLCPTSRAQAAGPKDVNREAELKSPSRGACSDLVLGRLPSTSEPPINDGPRALTKKATNSNDNSRGRMALRPQINRENECSNATEQRKEIPKRPVAFWN